MPKSRVSDWSATPADNTDIGGVSIAEGMNPAGVNDAMREIMAQVADDFAGSEARIVTPSGGSTARSLGEWLSLQTVTLYVDPAGSDANDGRTAAAPLQTLAAAASLIASYPIPRAWDVVLAAGTYAGAIFTRSFTTSRGAPKIKVRGPDVGMNVEPTAIIAQASGAGVNTGLAFGRMQTAEVQHIKTTSFTSSGISVSRFCDIRLTNVWDSGSNFGWQFNNNVTYTAEGGTLDGNVRGIDELMFVNRTIDTAASPVTVSNATEACLYSKEWTNGHMGALICDTAPVGIEFHSGFTANVDSLTLKGCAIGIVGTGPGELHEERDIVWGTGADACTRKYKLGSGIVMLQSGGWAGDPTTWQAGFRLPEMRYFLPSSSSFSTTVTQTFQLGTLYANEHATKGQTIKVIVGGKRTVATNGTVQINLVFDTAIMAFVTLPIGANTATFRCEFEVLCPTSGDTQRAIAFGLMEGEPVDAQAADRTETWSTDDKIVKIEVTQANASDETLINDIRFFA